ncbi:UDP-glucose/GDP-mannose dehydrogenase family protein [Cohnella xylanilytica]|uniref:UDP-glucose 6-dehydrogenase n=1 Tax=Cohnella xylanilytica TaxID=557555 RepID=A0A841TWE1_9BACL|nr:UDP-glucose/GDP-mannose dehydrogenase family protein [Cohnella xylanilytica]MBB6690493.1 UDP-glucose/GDP-mannose dehydrogenase family protein [Cohnella xylanilytica]
MKLAVVGAGIVGLTTGAGFAELGHQVECYDIDAGKIGLLTAGAVPYHEPGLQSLVERNVAAGRLRFGLAPEQLTSQAEVIFLAVGTPSADDGHMQLAPLWAAADKLTAWPGGGRRIVVVKSTVPVGTADRLEARLRSRLPADCEVHVASIPEFMREGGAVRDFFEPARIVIGTNDPETFERLDLLHRRLPAPILGTDRRTAELSKLAANAHLAVRLSFANEMAALAEQTGADYPAIARVLGMDPRIGPHFLGAGLGFGGSCLPKDARALVRLADEAGAPQTLVAAAIRANVMLPLRMVRKLEAALSGPSRRRVALLGLTFKPGTDDMREAPSIRLATELLRRHPGIVLTAYDPAAGEHAKRALPNAVQLCDSAEAALRGADAAILVTEWPEFRKIQAEDFKNWMKRPILLDGRNALDAETLNAQGVVCIGVGRLPATPSDALGAAELTAFQTEVEP